MPVVHLEQGFEAVLASEMYGYDTCGVDERVGQMDHGVIWRLLFNRQRRRERGEDEQRIGQGGGAHQVGGVVARARIVEKREGGWPGEAPEK